jgi:Cu-processing system permease protein
VEIARPQIRDVIRSRWLVCYWAFFFLAGEALLRFTGGDAKTLLSLANVVLFVVPLMTIIYGTIYLYNSREFTELLLAQPVQRGALFAGLYLGLALPLVLTFIAGVSAPFIIHGVSDASQRVALITMIAGGSTLTATFTGIAFWIALRFEDRLRGLGVALAIWLLMALAYDTIVLFLAAVVSSHGIERGLVGAMLANPIDLVRVTLLLQFDVSALMGYTGAVLRKFFSGTASTAMISIALLGWIALPLAAGLRAFRRKDF